MNEIQLKKLCKSMQKTGLGAMLICPSPLLTFLAGYTTGMCERFQGLFICASGERFYVCNKLYRDEITENMPGLELYVWEDGESMTLTVEDALREHHLLEVPIGVNSSAPAFSLLEIAHSCGAVFVNGVTSMDEARIIKSEQELANLRTAVRIADDAFEAALDFIRPGITEGEVRDFLFEKMTKSGGGTCWGIVASGPNASFPHYHGLRRQLGARDSVILDFGCSVQGMFSDISRTVFIGNPSEEERHVYQIVLQAQQAAVNAAVDGAYVPAVDAAARDIICAAGYGELFISRVGHGIGYMLHEEPYIQKDNRRYLQPGMVFSIEPGIYLPGRFGIRIEDIVAVTPMGHEVLNLAPKNLIVL